MRQGDEVRLREVLRGWICGGASFRIGESSGLGGVIKASGTSPFFIACFRDIDFYLGR